MIIITDANIILSGIINPYGIIASLLIQEHPGINFMTPEYALSEINLHKKRICTKQKIKPVEFDILLDKFLTNITLAGNDTVTEDIYRQAEEITSPIDTNDTWYIAFCIALDALLWTGDLKLHYALRKQQFYKSIITAEFNSILKGI
ncbi:MAG TPA: PIN domain-containing protein [Ferruginibacter sp.]|nr:PIN domain-containing protein [Ferruginibacter sp.]HPH89464.1 PIN domain-containing protein [Ferruginibacter sp.]